MEKKREVDSDSENESEDDFENEEIEKRIGIYEVRKIKNKGFGFESGKITVRCLIEAEKMKYSF